MRRYLLYVMLGVSMLLVYISISLLIIGKRGIDVNYNSNEPRIYTIYLDGEVTYRGELSYIKGTRLKDFIYDYLTKYSDYTSFNENDHIENHKTYYIGYIEKLDINTCSKAELMRLDGVGDVYSEKIISNRPYQNISELRDKKIVGEVLYASIKNKICC